MKIDLSKFEYNNPEEFKSLVDEIFKKEIYHFESRQDSPFIIDAGAHIGLATGYFKGLYPDAKIIAFEPNPDSAQLFNRNIDNIGLSGITLYPNALAGSAGVKDFYIDSSDKTWDSTAGFIDGTWKKTFISKKVEVNSLVLSNFITSQVDMLKLDIEGAELRVLEECVDKLHYVKNIIVESHPISPNSHRKIVKLLIQCGYKIRIFREHIETDALGIDDLLLIYAARD